MTPDQLQEFKTILKKAESRLVRTLVEDREDMWRDPLLGREAAPGDVGHRAGSLQEIREALARIENDVFGVCTGCGKAVGSQRLTAMPWAPVCIGCEENVRAVDAGSLSFTSARTQRASGTGLSEVKGAQSKK